MLAFAVFIFAIVGTMAYKTYNTYTDTISIAHAQSTTEKLSDAAEMVRSEGEGAKTTLVVVLPPGYSSEESYIGSKGGPGRTINLRLALSDGEIDIYSNCNVDVDGEFPENPGEYRYTVLHNGTLAVAYR